MSEQKQRRHHGWGITDELFEAVAERLRMFTGWPGFPANETAFAAYVRAVARFAHNKPIGQIFGDMGLTVDDLGDMDPQMNDLDWLFDTVYASLQELPRPIALRRIYEERLPPRTADSLQVDE